MNPAVLRLAEVSRQYEALATAYAGMTRDAAVAESEYRKVRAKRMLRATVAEGASAAKAEIIADADDDVAAACLQYKTTAAVTEATRAKLTQLREQVAVGRSVLVSDREADRLHTQGLGGQA